jgi:hypothetical protein
MASLNAERNTKVLKKNDMNCTFLGKRVEKQLLFENKQQKKRISFLT